MPAYMSGFGNEFESEALPGALPKGQNSPQRCPYGLYAEQIPGSAFTAPHGANRRSWLYRMRPSVLHARDFYAADSPLWETVAPGEIGVVPRGVKFRVTLEDGPARGYLCENYGAPFTLPNRGVIGANCLADARDFLTPVASFEDVERACVLTFDVASVSSFAGRSWLPRRIVDEAHAEGLAAG